MEGDGGHIVLVANKLGQPGATRSVPQAYHPVLPTTGDDPAVRADSHTPGDARLAGSNVAGMCQDGRYGAQENR